ncbi:hypothetical protein [Mesorhizobium sp. M00.F.Ca.ET.216.01.1.1]|uniref:hypothetical protein n=1 Tax=Mesorhizobium sp. M00.F.Ca.ET.216.01.1.1 TaxID=2500528 RepID=UPI000FDB5A02|nr:hypothetical protein [Mesorhizobium sp. M00.F.Ca.ET.216.01.1.1]TGQ30415.1 hypothetical protein EN859_031905 [Mesorhizobium sp. M00.F.Ca.ET.216.01.1.1]TJW03691.1 MAG: hypothetical protein E5W82_32460 [Mesorhizobium sp.]
MDWHDVWSENGRYLAGVTTARAVLFAAVTFGIMFRIEGRAALAAVMRRRRSSERERHFCPFSVSEEQFVLPAKSFQRPPPVGSVW